MKLILGPYFTILLLHSILPNKAWVELARLFGMDETMADFQGSKTKYQ